MLSARARNVLTAAGFDLTDLAGTVLKVRGALATGMRWRNCGKKTLRELEAWAGEPTVQANRINEELVERGAVAVLESRGYTVIPPNKGASGPGPAAGPGYAERTGSAGD